MGTRMNNRSVIVTGGSKGLGRGIAQVFAREGAKVLIVARGEDAGNKTVQEIRDSGGTVSFFRADVGNSDEVKGMAQAAIERYGGIDVLCCNAGIFPSTPLEKMSEAEWDLVNTVNLKGAFLCVQACLPEIKKSDQGRVLLMSSITGPITGYTGWSHYGATKAGMLGFMRTAAVELARSNITINAVMPGNVMSEGLDELGEEYLSRMEQAIPLGKLGDPEDVAYAMLFLASHEAKYITGQTLVVDGGQTIPESMDAM